MITISAPKIVLVADDDPDTREIVGSAVSLLGFTPMLAKDGQEALEKIGETEPDLAILDVMMPGLSGLEVCEKIKAGAVGELIPVLILTARDTLQDKVSALQDGADDYLTKPFHFRELQARITALLRVREMSLILQEKNRELQKMQEKLLEQERMLVTSQLAGTAAHQLGQPLSAILLNCSLLESLKGEDPKFLRALGAVKADIKRMSEMIERLRVIDPKKVKGYFEGMDILDLGQD